jgi:16S rRNA (cytidine1402-2'-O)-methyltransferase
MKSIKTMELPAGLYLVATPIGNLRDMTLRAIDVLAQANIVLCEDTRVTGKLLKAHDIKAKMQSYNDHNADRQRGQIIETITAGKAVALVSDAGMPLISDPGYKLVRDCIDLGLMVTTLPGANAVLSALQLSGLPSDKFSFLGFLPSKAVARKTVLNEWKDVPSTLITYEGASRLVGSLSDMLAVLGDRPAAVVREITKMFEESRTASLSQLVSHYTNAGAPKGEIVIVIAPPKIKEYDDAALRKELSSALRTMRVKDAAAHVAEITGVSKSILYQMALDINDKNKE